MDKIQDIVSELRLLYPDLEIISWEKGGRGRLIINDKVIFRFDPDFIEKQLVRLGKTGFYEIVKIWAEYIQIRYIKRKNRFDKKPNGRPGLCLTESQIRYAVANTKSNMEAARFLNVNISTYRKYASIYDLYESHKNIRGLGIRKGGKGKQVPMDEILANKRPDYKPRFLKKRLINEMIVEEKCDICGYKEQRIIDGKIALLLDFVDGNQKNMSRENLRLLCYNCTFNVRGRIAKIFLDEFNEAKTAETFKEQQDKEKDIFDKFNPEEDKKDSFNSPIIQSNNDTTDDLWQKFNPTK